MSLTDRIFNSTLYFLTMMFAVLGLANIIVGSLLSGIFLLAVVVNNICWLGSRFGNSMKGVNE